MKIVAAIMDISFVKFCRKEWTIKRSTKKCLVYDPRIITSRHVEKTKQWLEDE